VLKEVLSDKRTPNYKEKISWNKATKPACMDVKCGRWWEKAIREEDWSLGNKVVEACREGEVLNI